MSKKYPELTAMVRGCYDLQKLRMQSGLRLYANFRAKLGITATSTEEEDAEAEKVLAIIKKSYDKMCEGVAKSKSIPLERGFVGDPVISTYTELILTDQYFELHRDEERQFRQLEKFLSGIPIWDQYLKDVVGVGPAMGGVIITEFDIEKAKYPSSLWRYAGLDVSNDDGLGRSRRENHLIEHTYTDKNGVEKTRMGISYNPFLKTKLTGVLAGSFLRTNSPWKEVYDGYKHRLETDPTRAKVTKDEYKKLYAKDKTTMATKWRPGRINDAAKRYMLKMFLIELYNKWRKLEGLPVSPTYQEWKFGHVHNEGRRGSDDRAAPSEPFATRPPQEGSESRDIR